MNPSEAAAIMRKHNEWRRWEGEPHKTPEMQSPELIGAAIDAAIEYIESREYKKP